MRDVGPALLRWANAGTPFALARVMTTWGSAPRRVGAAMAIAADGQVVGSVSGGCIEGEVISAAASVLASGRQEILEFGVENETAWNVGLSCGGTVRVLLERFPIFGKEVSSAAAGEKILSALDASRPLLWITRLSPESGRHLAVDVSTGESTGAPEIGREVVDLGIEAYRRRETCETESSGAGLFIHVVPPRPRLLIFGATDIAVHLVRLARSLDFETIVVDPREVFAAENRFETPPDRLVREWPQDALQSLKVHDETYAVLLTHDPKFDDPALHELLHSEAAYIGALGSSRTHRKRVERLLDAGLAQEAIDRIHGPVGLDIGAASPAEIALSVLAQVVQRRNRSS